MSLSSSSSSSDLSSSSSSSSEQSCCESASEREENFCESSEASEGSASDTETESSSQCSKCHVDKPARQFCRVSRAKHRVVRCFKTCNLCALKRKHQTPTTTPSTAQPQSQSPSQSQQSPGGRKIAFQRKLRSCKERDLEQGLVEHPAQLCVDRGFLLNALDSQHRLCVYCGVRMHIFQGPSRVKIERKDALLGHVKSNCVLCCWACQQLRGTAAGGDDDYGFQEFQELRDDLFSGGGTVTTVATSFFCR